VERRTFLASSLAASALAAASASPDSIADAAPRPSPAGVRDYYLLRRYHLLSGPQGELTHKFAREALIPALNKLGISPVGAFGVEIGPESPSLYLLMPSASLETLANLEAHLCADAAYLNAGAAFVNAPAQQPPFVRVESSLMIAFEGHPHLTLPPEAARHGARVFELRTYESPTDQDHRRKVEMFNSGEFDVFEKAGFWQIFYGDTLVGARQPNLTYMIGFANLADRDRLWAAFASEPGWKKLTGSPRFNFEDIVSSITNRLLSPTDYSQI
jgi:NIPSNAP